MARMLESDEAARRLGVKVATLYAYVSRGLLVSHRSPSGRRSLFEMDEVERLARRSRQGKVVETRMATITTAITQLTDEGPIYRGRRATDLATGSTFEAVAEWLWDIEDDDDGRPHHGAEERLRWLSTAGPDGAWSPRSLGRPPDIGPSDRVRWAVVMAGAGDPVRADLRPEAVTRAARRVAASMVAMVAPPEPDGREPRADGTSDRPGPRRCPLVLDDGRVVPSGSMAERLTVALSAAPTPELVRAVNAALVLMADHELATSTMAVRMAASTRADVYDALLVGLGTIAGPLHGGASQLAYSLLVDAERLGVERALDDTLRWQGTLPGFGHSVYKNGDARCTVLLHLFDELADPEQVEMVRSLMALAAAHTIPLPNVDLALAAIAWSKGMPPDAGRALFTVARVAGWVAHYLEELEERPLRYRARAVYAASGRR
jgi:citrate synthase